MQRLTMQGYGYILTMTACAFLMMPVHARAADDQVITLTCDGSVTAGTGRAEQVSKMGMVINRVDATFSCLAGSQSARKIEIAAPLEIDQWSRSAAA
jgi:hypothetical protein